MDTFQTTIKEIVQRVGLNEPSVDFDAESKRVSIFVDEGDWLQGKLPELVKEMEHIFRLIAKKNGMGPIYVDINNYRKERERLIIELAKAAARKSVVSKGEVKLPPMNAYERRIVHSELSTRPDIKTESFGEGKERYVLIKPI